MIKYQGKITISPVLSSRFAILIANCHCQLLTADCQLSTVNCQLPLHHRYSKRHLRSACFSKVVLQVGDIHPDLGL